LEDEEYKNYQNQTANITMFDTMANENVVTRCIHFGKENSYVNMDRKPATEVDPVVFSNKLMLDTFRSGVLELRPGGRKKLQWVKLEMPIFFVVSGFVQVTFCTVIETSPDQSQSSSRTLYKKNSVDLKTGDDFCVPFGNAYEIENLRQNKPALLRFILLRPPAGDQG